jgi:hypothetical protein
MPLLTSLAGGVADLVSELAYIPVYDLRSPSPSVVACLEVMVAAVADSTFLANIITTASDLLSGYAVRILLPLVSAPCAGLPLLLMILGPLLLRYTRWS